MPNTRIIQIGRFEGTRSKMYERNDVKPPATSARSSAVSERCFGDIEIAIDLDRLSRYYERAVTSRGGKTVLARGAIRIVARNRSAIPVPPPEWAKT